MIPSSGLRRIKAAPSAPSTWHACHAMRSSVSCSDWPGVEHREDFAEPFRDPPPAFGLVAALLLGLVEARVVDTHADLPPDRDQEARLLGRQRAGPGAAQRHAADQTVFRDQRHRDDGRDALGQAPPP